MPTQTANMVQMSVSGTPGTGTITLGSAVSGYQSLASAYGANATVDVEIKDGTAWEVARNCTYTHSGTTLTRGTLEASSTGSAISLTSAAIVSIVATADRGRTWNAAALEYVLGTDADTTMAVNSLYRVDMAAWATADRTYTLPATAAVGDRVGIMVSAGDASHELIITAASGDTLNTVSGGTEWSRLFITGEVVIMRCVTADSTWVVEHDGRIPQKCTMRLSTNATGETANTLVQPTAFSGAWTADVNVGSIGTVSDGKITVRRAGNYSVQASGGSVSGITDQKHFGCGVLKNSTTTNIVSLGRFFASYPSGLSLNAEIPTLVLPLAADDYLAYVFRSEEGSKGLLANASPRLSTAFMLLEILP